MAAFMRPCFFFIYLVLLPVNVVTSSAHISDKRKCSDEDCEGIKIKTFLINIHHHMFILFATEIKTKLTDSVSCMILCH